LCLLGWCLLGGIARAQTTLYIDNNGTSSGFGWANGVTATWDANTTSVWTSSAAGTNATQTWTAIGGNSSTVVGLNGTVSTSTVIVVGNFTIAGLNKNTSGTTQITINATNSLTFAPSATLTAVGQLTFTNLSPLGDFTLTGGGNLRLFQSYSGNITNNSTVLEIAQSNNIYATNMNVNLVGSSQLNMINGGYNAGIGSLSGNSTSALINISNFTVNQSQNGTFQGVIYGSRISGVVTAGGESNFTKNGSATLALTGNNTYAGATVINAGTLSIATIANAGIRLTGNYVASNATVTANSTAGLAVGMTVVSTSATARQSISSISGATFTMNANASSAGTNVVSLVGFANGLGLSDSTATNLQIGNATLRYTGVTASTDRNFTLINGTTAGIDVSQAGTTLTMSGSASSTSAAFNKLGNGTLAFTGNHSYTGATTISAGTLSVSTLANGLSVSSIGQSTNVASNLILNGGTLQYTGVGVSTDRLFSLQSSSTIDASGTGALNLSNIGTMGFNGGTAVKTLTLTGNNTGSNTVAAVIGDNGNATSVIKAGTGTWVLTGANSYSGGTTISNGTLILSGAAGSAGSGNVSISSGAALQIANSGSTTISNNISGAGDIAHTSGTGVTTTLSGNNSNTGAIQSTGGGTLLFSGANALSSGITSLNATSASTLSFVDGTTRTITLGSSGISLSSAALSFDVNLSNSTSDRLNFSGAANLTGTNTVNLSFLNSLSGAQTWTLLTAASGLDSGIWSLGTYTNQSGYTFSLNSTATTLSLIASAGSSEAYWTGAGGTSWTATNFSSTINGGASIPGGNLTSSSIVIFAGTGAGNLTTTLGANYTIKSLTVSTPEVAINGSNTINVTSSSVSGIDISAAGNTTIGANLAGNAGLSKSGTGTLTLNGSNTYSGGTTITGGTVVIGSSTAFGNAAGAVTLNPGTGNTTTVKIGASNLNVSNNIVLNSGTTAIDTNSFNATASGILSSSGALTKLGAGTLALSGNNSHAGSITISTGTLEIASTGLLGGGTYLGAITNNGTLTYSGANNQTLGGVVSGNGALIQNATSTLTLSGNNTYTGATTINAGVLNIQDANALGTTANGTTVVSGAALQLQGNILVGAEALTLSGNGVSNDGALRNISGSNTYAGAITLNAATRINSDSGVLTLTGNIGGAGQNLTLGGAGTTILTGSNTYSGATIITAGTLQVGNAGTTGNLSTSSSITNNGTLTFNRSNNITQGTDFGTVISGTGSLIQAGSGNLVLSGANTYTGNTTLNSGTLCINNSGSGGTNSAIGTGTLIINSGTISNTSGSLVTLSTNNTQIWNAGFTFNGTNDLNLGTGNVTLSTGLSVTTAGGNLTVGGVISGSNSNLNKYGSGILNLSGNSSYTGITNIYVGTLSVSILANGGASSSIGQSSNAADRLVIAGAGTTLRYTGAAASTDRLFTLSNSGTIDASGTGALNFTNTGSITLGTGAKTLTLTGNNTGLNTLALAIGDNTGATSLTKNGTGTWVLSGNNSYSGATTISAGTLSIANIANGGTASGLGGSTSAEANLVLNGGTLNYTGASASSNRSFTLANSTSSGIRVESAATVLTISGTSAATSGSLTKSGDGTLALTGNNSYSGGTTISAGTAQVGHANALGTSGNITFSGGTMSFASGGSGADYGARIKNSASSIILDTNGQSVTFSGAMDSSNAGGLTKNGTGMLTLNSANAYTGGTTISAGTLQVGHANALGTSGNITFSGGTMSFASGGSGADYGARIKNSASSIILDTNGQSVTFSGPIDSSNAGGLTKNGTGTLTLSGANTYTGGTAINAGTLALSGASGALGSSNVAVGSSAVLELGNSGTPTVSNNISGSGTIRQTGSATTSLNGTNTNAGAVEATTGTLLFSGAGALSASTTSLNASNSGTLSFADGTTRNSTISGNISLTGSSFLKFDINGASSDFLSANGTASLSGLGKIQLNLLSAPSGPTTYNLLYAGGGLTSNWTLDANSFAAGAFNWNLSTSGNNTLQLIATASSTNTYWLGASSGNWSTLANWAAGANGSGSGVLPQAGYNVFFDSTTPIGNLTTTLGGQDYTLSTLTISKPEVTINGSNTLNVTTSALSAIAISATGNTTINANLAGAAGLTKSGTGTLTLGGNNSFTGGASITGGTLILSGGLNNSSVTVDGGTLNETSTGTIAGASSTFTLSSGNATLAGNNTYGGATTITLGTLEVGTTGRLGGGSYAQNIANNGAFIYSGTNNQTLSGIISGSGALTHNASSTLTLAGNNTYSGATTINAGTLEVTTTGRLGGGSYAQNIANNGAFIYSGTNNQTLSGIISGSGALTHNGSSTLTLSGNNTYSGATTITVGTLELTTTGRLGGGSYAQNIVNNGAFIYSGTNNQALSGFISGSGALTHNASSTLTLAGNNTYSGATTINAGTLEVATTGRLGGGSYAQNIVNNGAFIYSGTNNQTLSGIISGSGLLTHNSSSTLTIAGNNTYSGATTINAGTLQIGAGGTTGSLNTTGAITINGTLAFNRSNTVTQGTDFNSVLSGAGNLIQTGSGNLILTGNNTYTGTTTINAGTLEISSTGRLGGGSYAQNILNNGSLIYSANSNQLLAGIISGSGSFTLNGVASTTTVTLTGNSSYTGNTTVNKGYLNIQHANALGSSSGGTTVESGAVLQLSGGITIASEILTLKGSGQTGALRSEVGNNEWAGDIVIALNNTRIYSAAGASLKISGNMTNNGDSTTQAVFGNIGNGTILVSGNMGGNGRLVVVSDGVTITGNNTFSGTTDIQVGTVSINSIKDVGAGASSLGNPLTSANGTIHIGVGANAGGIRYTGSGDSSNRIIQLEGTTGGTTIDQSGTGTLKFTSNFTAPNAGNKTLVLQGSTAGIGEITGTIPNSSGNLTGLTKNGTGTWILSGNNTYSGDTTINAGTLQIGNGNSTGSLSVNSTILNNATLAFNRSDTVTQGTHFSSNGVSGTGNLTQSGSGNLILNAANSYSGSTNINSGTLTLSGNGTLGTSTITLTGGTLDMGGKNLTNAISGLTGGTLSNGTITNNGGSYALQNGTVSAVLAGTNGLTKTGSSTLILSGNNTFNGSTTISAGNLSITSTSALASTSGISIGDTAALIYTGSAATLNRTIMVTSGTGTIRNNGSGLLTLSGSLTKDGTTLTLAGGSGGITVNGAISGSSANSDLVIDGGSVTLSSANTYNGPTSIINGATLIASVATALPTANGRSAISIDATGTGSSTLTLGMGQSIASLTGAASSNVTLGSNTLTIGNASGSTTFAGRITGTGALVKDGASTQILSGTNTYTGGTTISAGNLTISGGSALADNGLVTLSNTSGAVLSVSTSETIGSLSGGGASGGNVAIASAQTLTVNQTTNTTFSGAISGANLVKTGSGTLTVNGTNTYTGTTTVNGGTLTAASSNALGGTSQIIVNNGGSFLVTADDAVNNNANVTLAGGTLAVNGTFNESVGLLTLSANSVIDLSGFVGTLRFSGVGSWANTANLAIWNWNGINQYNTPVGDGANNRHIVFTDATGLDTYLDRISFYSGSGTGFSGSGFAQGFSGGGTEIIAVPEPETYATAGILLFAGALLQWMRRKQRT